MRRVMALWLSVALASLVGGLAVAQETAPEAQPQEAQVAAQPAAAQPAAAQPAAAPSDEVVTDASAPAVSQADQDMDAGTYATRLRDLEQRIDALKEQIFRSKARLSLLAETVLQGVVAGAQAVIIHENRMSSSYRLVKVQYALDGARIFNK